MLNTMCRPTHAETAASSTSNHGHHFDSSSAEDKRFSEAPSQLSISFSTSETTDSIMGAAIPLSVKDYTSFGTMDRRGRKGI
jgi:hypothetical protein